MAKQTTDSGLTATDDDFSGNYPMKADSALRVTVPNKFKQILEKKYADTASTLVLVPDKGKVRVLPVPAWTQMKTELDSLPTLDPNAQALRGLIFGTKVECQLDAQNRIRLTPDLCRLAGISKEVVFAGNDGEMQIWDANRWNEFTTSRIQNIDALYASVFAGMKG